jgi:transposase
MTRKMPEIIEVNSQQLEELLERATSNTLREEDTELIGHVFESYMHLFEIVGDKNTTIARLRKLFFGASSEKTEKIIGEQQDPESSLAPDGDNAASEQAPSELETDEATGENPPPGHGRHSARDYLGATQVDVSHPTLCAGDDCPHCQKGTIYEKSPRLFVRFVGQAPLHATVYRLQRLRCSLCGKVFTAPAPEEMGAQKYDHTVASMIGLLKYGSGMPFNRLQGLQRNCAVPLAASTQWDIVHAGASLLTAAYEELIRQAAQGEVLYNDDTTVKILELMGKRAERSPPPDDPHDPNRTGLFTSGVVSTCAGQRIALFFTGRQHAGENLSDVLKHRAAELGAPIQMCDGLSRNLPRELATILANCMAHGRRKFTDLYDRFTGQCRYVINAFKVIYYNDKVARERDMSPDERLAYHQTHSKPTMDNLKQWLQCQFDEKLVEPNSALGEAISYLLKRWDALTLFLRKAGAPLDNNICERALKKSILLRKNSLFFKTRNGARVGDIYMSLIHTCELNDINAFDYLNQLQLNALDVVEHPDCWMPWNYQDNVADGDERSDGSAPEAGTTHVAACST